MQWHPKLSGDSLIYHNYDAAFGRIFQLDPVAAKYASLTPYNYSFNNPAGFSNPSGADPDPQFQNLNYQYYFYTGNGASGMPGLTYDDWDPSRRWTAEEYQYQCALCGRKDNMMGWFSGGGPSLNAASFGYQTARYVTGVNAKAMADLIVGAYNGGDGSTLMRFTGGRLSSYDFKSTSDLLKMAGEFIARSYYGGDGSMPAGYMPANHKQFPSAEQVVGMLPQDADLDQFEFKTTTYQLSEVIGMHVATTYSPSSAQRSIYSKFNFVVTVSTNVSFHNGAMGRQGAYTNMYPLDGKPTFYSEDGSREVLGYNALTSPTSNAWYNVFVSVVGYANGAWNVIDSFNFGWSNTSGHMEFNLPSKGYIPLWHYESIHDETKW